MSALPPSAALGVPNLIRISVLEIARPTWILPDTDTAPGVLLDRKYTWPGVKLPSALLIIPDVRSSIFSAEEPVDTDREVSDTEVDDFIKNYK